MIQASFFCNKFYLKIEICTVIYYSHAWFGGSGMPKYVDIANSLREQIHSNQLRSGSKLPTEETLTKEYSASRQTVRQALSILRIEGLITQIQGSGTYVSDQTRAKIKKNKKQRLNIAVICTYISDYIFPTIIRGIENELTKNGLTITLIATGNRIDRERSILQEIIDGMDIDGIIVEGTKTGFPNPNVPLYRRIMEMDIPLVFLHSSYPELENTVVVGMDDYEGGRIASRKLLEHGCQKIAGIFKSDDKQGLQRYSGFSQGILDCNKTLDCAIIRWFTTEDIESRGIHLTREQVRGIVDAKVDGVVCYNDQIASAFIRDFHQFGAELPTIVSFDHSSLCKASIDPYPSLSHKKEELGRVAAEKIVNMLDGKKEESVYMEWGDFT